ncbi:MAG TPA: hypothetical protein VI565_02275 [Burkholderiales bacterium]|nr:hypothetical protein [Burkholderiales bacterium]
MLAMSASFYFLILSEVKSGTIATLARSPLSARQILLAKFVSVACVALLLQIGPMMLVSAAAYSSGFSASQIATLAPAAALGAWAAATTVLGLSLLTAAGLAVVRSFPFLPLTASFVGWLVVSILLTFRMLGFVFALLGAFIRDPVLLGDLYRASLNLTGISPYHAYADLLFGLGGVAPTVVPWVLLVVVAALVAWAWPGSSRLYVDRIASA